jgi:ATP-dependent DNA helicase RecQ
MNNITINDQNLYNKSLSIIKNLYGENAKFRDGQYEAIESTVKNRRTLVVQRTGWGKSLVYFVSTKLFREAGKGATFVVSPLLVLMENQVEAAKKLGLTCALLNGEERKNLGDLGWIEHLNQIKRGEVDLVFVTPETLFNKDVQRILPSTRIGLFVIDEAHCISDWGHDFRLEYCRLKEVLSSLAPNIPVLATTATANNRVVADLEKQLGDKVYISRGPLTRDSLYIQVLHLKKKPERYAWILENINKLPGSGIIYCTTTRDCDYLADFLMSNGISAIAYHSKNDEAKNLYAITSFKNNKIKVIVATIKLGMGYDKGDISFIIHFQMPKNIVTYYQQIGRAGRNINKAYVFLMTGQEDINILDYFIKTAFPTKQEMEEILHCIQANRGGCSKKQLSSLINIKSTRIEKSLSFLINDGYVYKDGSKYFVSPKVFVCNEKHYKEITDLRHQEIEQMKELTNTKKCYSKFIVRLLDDPSAKDCGHCANCLSSPLFSENVSFETVNKASSYINNKSFIIEPRKQWPAWWPDKKAIKYINNDGLCLSRYGDAGYGELVARDKYSGLHQFCEELIEGSAKLLMPLIKEKNITHITNVPSLRSNLVQDFAKRLAKKCNLTYIEMLKKLPAAPQKAMENSAYQSKNAFDSFSIINDVIPPKRILLVDDIVDSKWTLTVCGYLLMSHGCWDVYPFALADSSQEEG